MLIIASASKMRPEPAFQGGFPDWVRGRLRTYWGHLVVARGAPVTPGGVRPRVPDWLWSPRQAEPVLLGEHNHQFWAAKEVVSCKKNRR